MKKWFALALAALLMVGVLTGCSSQQANTEEGGTAANVKIRVGASPTPHAEILEAIAQQLKDQGVDMEIVIFTDYIMPNTALEDGSLDANYFQHKPYMEDFNANNGSHLVSVAAIHYEPFGLYAGKTKSLEELKDGASISVPNDPSNESRALLLLQDCGLIKLKDGVGLEATVVDIVENPKNLKIVELEAAQLPRTLQDVDMAVINGNYAIDAGLSATKDALAMEDKDSTAAQTYANILAVKEGNEENEAIQKLIAVLTSEECRKYIEETFTDGSAVPMF